MAARAADDILVQRLIDDIIEPHYGKPILVIGGGGSVRLDLAALPDPSYFSAVISANDHGCRQHKYPVTYMHNLDTVHSERKIPMREFMRPFGFPVINQFGWADILMPKGRRPMNSGLSAVALAAVLGGHPVVTTGIDMWIDGNVYFHRVKDVPRIPPSRVGVKNKMTELQYWVQHTVVRSLRGPVAEHYGRFDINEALPDVVPHSFRSATRAAPVAP